LRSYFAGSKKLGWQTQLEEGSLKLCKVCSRIVAKAALEGAPMAVWVQVMTESLPGPDLHWRKLPGRKDAEPRGRGGKELDCTP
jgi:hypothetical protein